MLLRANVGDFIRNLIASKHNLTIEQMKQTNVRMSYSVCI